MNRTLVLALILALLLAASAWIFLDFAASESDAIDPVEMGEELDVDPGLSVMPRREGDDAVRTERLRRKAGLEERGEAEISGRVLEDASGRPIRGVAIEILLEAEPDFLTRRMASDGRGLFRAEALPPVSRAYVSFRGRGYGTLVLGPFVLTAGEERDLGDVRLTPGTELLGRVTRTSGEGIEGASVTLRPLDSPGSISRLLYNLDWMFKELPAVARVVTAEGGRFRLEGVPAGTYHVTVSADGFGDLHRTDVWVNSAGRAVRYEFVLPDGASLFGRIVDAAGRPVPEARVCVLPTLSGDDLSIVIQRATTVTAEDGSFRFDGLEAGGKDLLIARGGGLFWHKEKLWTSDEPVEVTVPGTVWLTGRAVRASDDTPLAGITLVLGGGDQFVKLVTDASGEYRVGPLKPARFRFLGQAPGLVLSRDSEKLKIDDAARKDGEVRHDLLFTAGAVIKGRVVEADTERPIAGAAVTASKNFEDGDAIARAVSDEDGSFTLTGVSLNGVRVFARAAGYAFDQEHQRKQMKRRKLDAGEVVEDVVVKLVRPTRISGVVRDAAGDPVTGARVSAGRAGAFQLRLLGEDGAEGMSGDDGGYVIETGQSLGTVKLNVTHPDFAPMQVDAGTAGAGELTKDVVLSSSAVLAGRVVDLRGTGIPGLEVAVQPKDFRVDHRQLARRMGLLGRTGPDGRWTLRVPPGPLNVDVRAPGMRPLSKIPENVAPASGDTLTLPDAVYAKLLSIAGVLEDRQKRRRREYVVFIRSASDGFECREARPANAGAFEVVVPEGLYDVHIQARGKKGRQGQSELLLSGIPAGTRDLTVLLPNR